MSRLCQVRLSDHAEQDLIAISRWSAENFGPLQAEKYVETIFLAIESLRNDPRPIDANYRDELGAGVHILHIARQGRKGRHFVVYRLTDEPILEVLRLLHDSMDLARHLPLASDYSQ